MTAPHAFRPQFADPGVTSPAVAALRGNARIRFEKLGFPNRSHEEWRFTPVSSLVATPFTPASHADVDIDRWLIPGCRHLVFVNGSFDGGLPEDRTLGDGVTVMTMARALTDSTPTVDAHLGRYAVIEDNPFAALNTAQDLEGVFIHLEPGTSLPAPLQIIYVTTGHTTLTYPRTLVVCGEDATATIVETYVGDDETFTCPVTEMAASSRASIRHIRLQEVSPSAFHVGALGVGLEDHAHYSLSTVSLGGQLSRLDATVNLAGEHAHASLDGLTMVDGRRIGDHHIRIEHQVPNCTSTQRFRSVLADRGRAVFTGRIIVAEDAQQTDANQSSRSLVLSPDAVAFNNPQLEIYADDVRCTHGSTVGQLDDDALFYLRARGIGREQGERMLTRAFAAEVLDAITIDAIRSRLDEALESFFEVQSGRS